MEEPMEIVETSALREITAAEIDTQIATARKFPRDEVKALDKAKNMALASPEIAESCFYVLPRGGKDIEGPSVRLAEILQHSWGNMRAGSRVIDIGEKQLVSQGVAHDLETNSAITREVSRRITKKNGERFSDDMITTAANAANSIAYRNAFFASIPRPLWEPIYQAARERAAQSEMSVSDRFEKACRYFARLGVTKDAILALLERRSEAEVTQDNIQRLIGIKNAIADGDLTIPEAFPNKPGPEDGFTGGDDT